MRRNIVLLLVSLSLFAAFSFVFVNLTEVDIILRQSLRAFVPQAWQDALRPLRAPMVIGLSPDWEATDVSLRSPVAITFLTPMHPSLTESSVLIDPSIAGQFSWRGRVLVFTPTEDWPMQTRVTVTVTREARSWLLRRMEREFTYTFTTLGPPFVVQTEPAQDARYTYLRDRLTITFNRPMDHESVETRLHIAPEMAGLRVGWRDEQLIISGVMKPSTEYRVRIDAGARDTAYRLETPEDFEWSFITTERPPHLAITGIGREVLVSAEVPTKLQLSLVNVTRVALDLYPVEASTYISMTAFSYDDWRRFTPADEPLRSWSLDPGVSLDRDEERPLELEPLEPGIYFLTARSPEGVQDGQILVSTQVALALKRAPGQLLAWATSLLNGHPLAGLPLMVYDDAGSVVARGQTDSDGILIVDTPGSSGSLFVLAEGGDTFGLCADRWQEGIEPWRFESVLWDWDVSGQDSRLFLYTDHPMYYPGQNVYFKGVVRLEKDGNYSTPPHGTPVDVTVANYDNTVLYQQTLETNAFGSVNDGFVLNPELELGEYFIKAKVGDDEYETAFHVEEPIEPPFEVKITTDSDAYTNGQVISGTVQADYLFGAPVADARVEYTVYSNDYYFHWGGTGAGLGDPVEPRYYGYGREVGSGDGFTDELGTFHVTVMADITREERSQIFTLEATVTDAGNQSASSATSFLVHRGEFYVGLLPERRVVVRGQGAAIRVETVDTTGLPLGDADLHYKVDLIEWRKVRRTGDGLAYLDWQEVVSDIKAGGISTDRDGYASITFPVTQGGTYRIHVEGSDRRGNRILETSYVWASDVSRTVGWRYEEHDRIELVTDKDTYYPGDIARVLVQSPYGEATALVTIERGSLISHQVVHLEGNSSLIVIPVEKDYFPNVFVSVVLAPAGVSEDSTPGFKMGYAELKVDLADNELRIAVVPDKPQYEPGEMATYTIRTSDHLNRPVSAEVSLTVVDASLYSSAASAVQDIGAAFYGRQRLAVRSAHSLTVHVDRSRLVEDFGGGGGIGEQEPPLVFSHVAYWNPAIVTDEQGLARVQFQMPGNPATWLALAEGTTVDTVVGAAEAEVVTTKDLTLRPIVPHLLYVGDEAVVTALVRNHTGEALQAQVSLTATNLMLPPELSQTVVISQGEAVAVGWRVQPSQVATATVTMIARTDSTRDVAQVAVPLLPFGEMEVFTDAATAGEGDLLHVVSVPAGADLAALELDVAPSLAAGLIDSLEYLMGYPYGCVEQTVSRFVPGLLISEVLRGLYVDDEGLKTKLDGQVEGGLQRLYRAKHNDGGWGWWEDDESDPYQTAYVVFGLAEARRAGYDVNEAALRGGVEFLRQSLLETGDLNLKAYISHVLAECGEGDLSLVRSLSERRQGMSLFGQAHLALSLDALGDTREAKAVTDEMVGRAVQTAHTAHWQETTQDRSTMSSDGRTTALILQALLATDPENALIPKTVRWLMWTRSGGYWHTTQETASIVAALAQYLAATGTPEAPSSYSVFVNSQLVAEDLVTRENVAEHRVLRVSNLAPGDNEIRVVNEGAGDLHLATTLQYVGEQDTVQAARSLQGPLVQRQYEDPQTGKLLTSVRVGDLVRVRLTVEAPQDMWYVIVEDAFPAGTEAVDDTLSATGMTDGERQLHWSHADLRGEKAVFFTAHLSKGVYQYVYLIRATMAGRFRALPAEAKPMYEPEVWGRSTSSLLTVDEVR